MACAFVLCGMLMQSVNGTFGEERFYSLINTYRIPALNNLIIILVYVSLSP